MLTWIISIIITIVYIAAGICYAFAPKKHKVNSKKSISIKDKGTSMDERKIYIIPYEDFNLE